MNMRTPPSLLNEDDDGDELQAPPIIQNQDVDFSEYMWMEQMEEFDQQVEEELREQEMIEQGFEDLYEMEILASELLSMSPVENPFIMFDSSHGGVRTNGIAHARQDTIITYASVNNEGSFTSSLNPLAPEFVPQKKC